MINNKIGGHNMVGIDGSYCGVDACGMCCGWKEYRDGSKEGVQAFCYGADECEK